MFINKYFITALLSSLTITIHHWHFHYSGGLYPKRGNPLFPTERTHHHPLLSLEDGFPLLSKCCQCFDPVFGWYDLKKRKKCKGETGMYLMYLIQHASPEPPKKSLQT